MNQVNIIENYISKDTARFLYDSFSIHATDIPDPFIKSGMSVSKDKAINFHLGTKAQEYTRDNCNMSQDILIMLSDSIIRTVSEHFGVEMEIKSLFHSMMLPGSKNPIHYDNYPENTQDDISVLVYLSDDYEGGHLVFPDKNMDIKPKAGTFIFFKGTEDLMHYVTEVTSGVRHAFVGFAWPVETRKRVMA